MQTAVNPYVTILGTIESAAKRISIMGICNKFAGIIAPLLLATLLFSGTEHIVAAIETNSSPELRNNMLDTLALQLINPYIVMTIILVLLGFLILRTHLPEIDKDESTEEKSRKSIWQFPYMWIGVIALFLCRSGSYSSRYRYFIRQITWCSGRVGKIFYKFNFSVDGNRLFYRRCYYS